MSDEEAVLVGVSLEAEPVPDAFGEPRAKRYVSFGNLNTLPNGCIMIVR